MRTMPELEIPLEGGEGCDPVAPFLSGLRVGASGTHPANYEVVSLQFSVGGLQSPGEAGR